MSRYKRHIISYQDTVQSISQRHTGTVGNWKKIVDYNNLKYPYIVDDPQEKLKRPKDILTIGEEIIIPIEQDLLDVDSDNLRKRDKDLILGLALGRDLNMLGEGTYPYSTNKNGEVFELSANSKGDLKLAQGVDNLKQSIIARLLTYRGSHLLHPDYGSNIHNLIGMKAMPESLQMIDDEIESTIKKDGRVARVSKEHSTIDGEVYQGEFTITLHSFDEYFGLVIEGDETGFVIT